MTCCLHADYCYYFGCPFKGEPQVVVGPERQSGHGTPQARGVTAGETAPQFLRAVVNSPRAIIGVGHDRNCVSVQFREARARCRSESNDDRPRDQRASGPAPVLRVGALPAQAAVASGQPARFVSAGLAERSGIGLPSRPREFDSRGPLHFISRFNEGEPNEADAHPVANFNRRPSSRSESTPLASQGVMHHDLEVRVGAAGKGPGRKTRALHARSTCGDSSAGSIPSSGDGLGIHEPRSTDSRRAAKRVERQGRARDRAMCPAGSRNSSRGGVEGHAPACLERNRERIAKASRQCAAPAAGIKPGPREANIKFPSGDGLGIHQPRSTVSRWRRQGRARNRAMCPAVTRSYGGRVGW